MTSAPESPMPTPALAELLKRPDRPTKPTAGTTDRAILSQVPATAEPAAPIRPARSTRAAAPTPAGRKYTRSIGVYLPRSLHQRLGMVATQQDVTRTALMLTAVSQTHDRLGPRIDTLRGQDTSTGLFAVPQARAAAEPTTQTTIKVLDEQLQAIDELVRHYDSNRSQLIAAALEEYLP